MSSEIVRVNTPDTGVEIREVGGTHTTYYVDAEREEWPTARVFSDLTTAVVKLAVIGIDMPEAFKEEQQDLLNRVIRFESLLARERLDGEDAVRDLSMGNLDALPEVTAEHEYRRADQDE